MSICSASHWTETSLKSKSSMYIEEGVTLVKYLATDSLLKGRLKKYKPQLQQKLGFFVFVSGFF